MASRTVPWIPRPPANLPKLIEQLAERRNLFRVQDLGSTGFVLVEEDPDAVQGSDETKQS